MAHSHLRSKWPGGGDLLWPELTSSGLGDGGEGRGGREGGGAGDRDPPPEGPPTLLLWRIEAAAARLGPAAARVAKGGS